MPSPSMFLLLAALLLVNTEAAKMDHLQILDSLLKKDYDRRATPTNHLNNATTVQCELYIRSFGSISPVTMVPSLIDVTKRRLGRRSSSVNHIRLPKYLTQDLITLNHTPSTSVSCDRTKYDYSRYFYSSKSYSCEKEISSGTSKNSKPKINGPIQGNNITKCWLPTQLSNGMKTKASSDSNDPFNQFKNSTVGNDLFDDQPRGRTRFKGSDMRVTQSQCYFLEERNLGPQRVVKKVVPYTPLDSSEIKSAIFLARLTKSETLLDRKVPYKKQSRYSSKEEKSTDSGPSIKSNGTEEANLYAIRYSDLLHKYVESEKVADTSNNGMLKPDASSISEQVKSDANIKQSSTNEVTKAQSENIYETQEQEPKKTSQEVQKEKAPFKTQPSPKAQSAKNSSKYTPKDNAAIAKKRKRQTVFEIFDNSESHKKWRANLRSYAHRKVPERFKSGKNKLEIAVDDQAISMKIKYLEKKKSLYEIYQEFFPFTPPRSELAAEGLHLRGELRRRNKAMQMLKGTEMEQRLKPFDDEWWSDPQTVRARRGGGSSRRLRPAPSGEPLDFRGPLKYIMDRKAKMRSDLDL